MLRETEEPIIRTSYANVLAFFALRSTTGVSRSNAPDLSSPFILFHVSPLRKKVSKRWKKRASVLAEITRWKFPPSISPRVKKKRKKKKRRRFRERYCEQIKVKHQVGDNFFFSGNRGNNRFFFPFPSLLVFFHNNYRREENFPRGGEVERWVVERNRAFFTNPSSVNIRTTV